MSARTVLVALTVILAAPAAADTGDDYSNNLFSDIAPYANLYIPISISANADRYRLGCWHFSGSNLLNNS
jgi:hypothetical protein